MKEFVLWMMYAWWGFVALFVAEVIYRHFRPKKTEPAPPNELDALVRQERINQAVPLVTLVAMNLPVDVVSVTLITHYADGCDLALDCGRPERIEAEP